MSTTRLRPSTRARPLVAVVCAVPLLGEAMRSALEFAEVQTFSAGGGDLVGLVRWLRPDALIVDTVAGAEEATRVARDAQVPVLYISMQERSLRFCRDGRWETLDDGEEPTPDAIRNVVAGALFARDGVVT
jgi:hypothetical protein